MEINTVAELVRAVSDNYTGGYECCEMKIHPNEWRAEIKNPDGSRAGFHLIITVTGSEPGEYNINGEYWFWDDNTVMQVL